MVFLALASGPLSVHAPSQPPAASPGCPAAPVAPTQAQMVEGMKGARNRGFLWKISKDGRTSYLYGTIHVARMEWMYPGPAIVSGMRATDILALELDLLDPEILRRAQASMAPKPDRALPPDLNARLVSQLKAACLPEEMLTTLSPEMAVMTISVMAARRQGLEPAFGIDGFLSGFAKGQRKPVSSIETPEFQMKMLMGADARETAAIVRSSLNELEKGDSGLVLERLANAWRDSRLSELESYESWCECVNTATDRAMLKRLLNDRNPGMAAAIDALHTSGKTVFAAVGALHMTGRIGVPSLMAARGYTVERVDFSKPVLN